ncbi:MAG: hypothetical protein AB7G93_01300 [Bdellovibrionales bacterium]
MPSPTPILFEVTAASVKPGETFRVQLTPTSNLQPGASLDIHFESRNGTAQSDRDYLARSGDVVLTSGGGAMVIELQTLASGGDRSALSFRLDLTWQQNGVDKLQSLSLTISPHDPDDYRELELGYSHGCAIRYDAKVVCWGIGVREAPPRTGGDPILPSFFTGFKSPDRVLVGDADTCVHDSGEWYCWGAAFEKNADGSYPSIAAVGSDYKVDLSRTRLVTPTPIRAVAISQYLVYALTMNGDIYAFGQCLYWCALGSQNRLGYSGVKIDTGGLEFKSISPDVYSTDGTSYYSFLGISTDGKAYRVSKPDMITDLGFSAVDLSKGTFLDEDKHLRAVNVGKSAVVSTFDVTKLIKGCALTDTSLFVCPYVDNDVKLATLPVGSHLISSASVGARTLNVSPYCYVRSKQMTCVGPDYYKGKLRNGTLDP